MIDMKTMQAARAAGLRTSLPRQVIDRPSVMVFSTYLSSQKLAARGGWHVCFICAISAL
jgi:nitrogen fixation protein